MRANEFLIELTNTAPYDYVQTRNMGGLDCDWKFETDKGIIYTVRVRWIDSQMEIGFAAAVPGESRPSRNDVTGTGDAFRVFGTIKKIIQSYLASRSAHNGQPPFIVFSANNADRSRKKLYNMIASTAPKWIPGYKLSDVKNNGTETFYELKRKDAEVNEEQLDELNIDNKAGWGRTPNNQEIDYMGLKVMMRPSVFLRLAAHLNIDDLARGKIDAMKAHTQAGGTVAAPTLYIKVDDCWAQENFINQKFIPEVTAHEGRHRMNTQLELNGDVPVETHIFLRSNKTEWKARMITPRIIKHLNLALRSESASGYGIKRTGPFFTLESPK